MGAVHNDEGVEMALIVEDDEGAAPAAAMPTEEQEHNEAILIGDDRLVKVLLKIRDRTAALTKEYEAAKKVLDDQFTQVQNELIKRLHERGATQTKTQWGTAFLGEKMQVTIADEAVFHAFLLNEKDLDFFQKRVKVEHLREYMENHGGSIPPGLSLFREVSLNVRKAST